MKTRVATEAKANISNVADEACKSGRQLSVETANAL